ncbi:uncharacterized protein LOC135495295 [Lineus longissimus]|uniref:uncharacterized protein LOC135495295 n=1 Tax=Lineus longissimus TaxID=88925 RepID=UPI00315CF122
MAFVSLSGAFFITLISHLTRPLPGQGYQAKYYALKHGECNSTLTASSEAQNMSSLNYPSEYFPNLRCFSTITAQPGYRIILRILELDIPGETSCKTDKLVIKVSESDSGTQLCGAKVNYSRDDLEFQSVLNILSVSFISDYMLEGQGFNAEYTAVQTCSNSTESKPTGDFHSINYPNGYLNSQNCETTIVTNLEGRVIQVSFSYLVLESESGGPEVDYRCTKDYIEILDGLDAHRRCGDWSGRESQLVFNSFTNKMVVRFSTDHNVSRPGFHATWHAVKNESALLDCDIDWEESKKHCFKVFNEPRNWTDAATDCEQRLSYLAKVDNKESMVAITRIILQNKLHKDISCYWIGANDRQFENDFFWQDGTPVISPDWFPGWSDYSNFSFQPNDDGMAEQDCVELRQSYPYPSKGIGLAPKLYWNDMSCSMKNSYICMRTKAGVHLPPHKPEKINCSSTLMLRHLSDTGLLESPNFPNSYNNNDDCVINISTLLDYRIALTFSHFQLEEDSSCRYDLLELTSPHSAPRTENTVRRCGDWEDKVKLLHYTSTNNHLQLMFHSDHSRVRKGFKVRYAVLAAPKRCDESAAVPWSQSCYYFFANDTTDLSNASTECQNVKSEPLLIESQEELNFVTKYINIHYPESTFWLGESFNFTSTQTSSKAAVDTVTLATSPSQTGVCYVFENRTILSRKGNECNQKLNFICKTPFSEHSTASLTTTEASSGSLASSDYHPSSQNYTNNEKHTVIITIPADHRIIFDIAFIDLEYQYQCLYDFLNFMDLNTTLSKRFCGYDKSDLHHASDSNSVNVTFFTDSSQTGRGYSLTWKSVDISECNLTKVTEEFGVVSSLNFPLFYLDNLDCETWIVAATNKRIWLSFTKFELDYTDNICSDYLEITLSESTSSATMKKTSLKLCGDRNGRVNELKFVSFYNKIVLRFHSDSNIRSVGYQAEYKSIPDGLYSHVDMITVDPGETGHVVSPNYGTDYPVDLDYTVRIKTKLMDQIILQPVDLDLRLSGDCYYDSVTINDDIKTWQGEEGKMAVLCRNQTEATKWISHMNVISVRLQTKTRTNFGFKGTNFAYHVKQDEFFWNKTHRRLNITLDECSKTTCKNNGTCRNTTSGYECDCNGIHTGLFCHITWCELRPSPCKEGKCETNGSYVCKCDQGYFGHDCNMTLNQCNAARCSNNGWCKPIGRYGDYQCKCETGWDGKVCDESAEGTKSLGEMLIEEPFWIGIIIILVALFLTVFVWCFRKKCAHNFHCFRQKKDKVVANHNHDISRRPSPGDLLVYNNPVFSREGSPRYIRSDSRSNSLSVEYKDSWGAPSRKGPEQNAAAAARFFASLNDITREKTLMDTAGATYDTDSDANYMGVQGGQILLTPANLTIDQAQGGSVTPGPSPFLAHTPLAARSTDPGLKRVKSAREGGRRDGFRGRGRGFMHASHKSHSFDYGLHHSDTEVETDDRFLQFGIPNRREVKATIEPHKNRLDDDLDPEARSSARRRRAFATTPQITIQLSPVPGGDEMFHFEDEFGHRDGNGCEAQGDYHDYPRRYEKRLPRQSSSGDSTSIRLSPHGSEHSSRSGSVDICGGSRRGSSLDPTPRESRRHSLEPSREGSGHSTRRHSLQPSRDHSARGSVRQSLEPSRSASRRGSAGHSPSSKSSRRSSIAVSRDVSQRSSRRHKKYGKRRHSDQASPTENRYGRRQSRDSYHGQSRDTDMREHQSGSKHLQNRYLRDVLRQHLKNFAHRDLSFESTTGSDVGSVKSLGYLTESLDLPCDCDKCIVTSSKHRHTHGHRRRNLKYYSPKDSFESMPASYDVHSSDSLPSDHIGVRRTASAEPPGIRSSMRSSRSACGYHEEHFKQKSKKRGSGHHHRHKHRSDSKESKNVRHERWASSGNRGYSSEKDLVRLIPSIVVDRHRPVMQKSHSEDDYLNSRSQSPVNKASMPAQGFLRVPEMFSEHDHSASNESSSGIASSPSHSTACLALSVPEGLDYNPADYNQMDKRLFRDTMKPGARDRTDLEIIELENMVPINSESQNAQPSELRKDNDKTDPSESDRSSSSSGLGLMQGKRRSSVGSTSISAIEGSDPDDILLRNGGVLPSKCRPKPIAIRESHSMRRKHQFRDSAYQTKEHSMSKPPSNQVSPTTPNLIKTRPEPGISTKAQYTRPEDTSVTSQLFAAAKKLEHLQSDLNSRHNSDSETATTSAPSSVIYHQPVARKRSYGNGKLINISDIPESSQEIEDDTMGVTTATTDDSGHRGSYYSQESIDDRTHGKMTPYNTLDTAEDSVDLRDDEVFRTFSPVHNARSVLSVLHRQRLSGEAEEYVV